MIVGDKVRVKYLHNISNQNIRPYDYGVVIGFKEAVREEQTYTLVGVEFRRNIKGHSCGYLGKRHYCAWISKKRLQIVR